MMSSELDYEEAPEMDVPMVRDFLAPALRDWTRGCFPRQRGGLFLIWGWFILVYGLWVLLKAGIYVFGVALILLAFVLWVVAELMTYHHRRQRALSHTP
jgi:Flp pilus assembly protein TadB